MSLRILIIAFFVLSALVLPAAAQTSLEQTDLEKSRQSFIQGDYPTALNLCQDALNENPDSWQAYYQEALCYHAMGESAKALTTATEAAQMNPTDFGLNHFLQGLQAGPTASATPAASSNAATNLGTKPVTTAVTPVGPATNASGNNGSLTQPNQESQLEAETQVLQTIAPSPTPVPDGKKPELFGVLKLGMLGDYTNLGVLDTSAGLWQASLIHDSSNGAGSVSHLGFGGVVEAALDLGEEAAFSVRMSYRGGNGFTETLYNGPVSESQLIDPELATLGLDYYQYFPESFGRFFICLGGLLGEALVPVNVQTPQYTITGTMGGSALGAEVGLGNEFFLQPNLALEISLRYQTLVVNQVEINYTDNSGNSGELVLAQNDGQVFLADTRAITGSEGYAPLDFSGILIGASLSWRLF